MNSLRTFLCVPLLALSFSVFAAAQAESPLKPEAVKPICVEGDTSCLILVQNESVKIEEFGALNFVGVPEDSRCPIDVFCFWAGQVRVQLNVDALDESEALELGLGGNLTPTWTDSRSGSQLVLEQVWPERSFETPTNEPYQIKLRLLPAVANPNPIDVDPIDTAVQAAPVSATTH